MGQCPCQRVGFGHRQILQQHREPVGEQAPSRSQRPLSARGEGQCLPPPVVRGGSTLEQPGPGQPGDQLRDRGLRHAGPPCELHSEHRLVVDRAKGEVLRNGKRRIVRGEEPLDPAGRQWRNPDQRIGGVDIRSWRWRHT